MPLFKKLLLTNISLFKKICGSNMKKVHEDLNMAIIWELWVPLGYSCRTAVCGLYYTIF